MTYRERVEQKHTSCKAKNVTTHYRHAFEEACDRVDRLELAMRSIDAATSLEIALRRARKAIAQGYGWDDRDPDPSRPKPLAPLENWQQNDEHNVR